jgi:TonB family protein
MDRIQKKCFIASAGFHLLLVVILFIGPAFLSAPKKADTQEIITLFNPDLITANGPSGGGHPAPNPPSQSRPNPPPPQPSQKKSEPEKAPDPEPQKETKVTKARTDANSYESKKPKLSAADLTPTRRSKSSPKAQKKTTAATSDDSEQKQLADSRRRIGEMLRSAASGMNAASATKIDDHVGPGGGGPAYASYASLVQMTYWDAWAAPEDATSESAVVDVLITIKNDGTVLSSRIVKHSGDSAVDASVQRTLNRVISIDRPFPEGMNEKQHTYTLHFDLKAKKGLA